MKTQLNQEKEKSPIGPLQIQGLQQSKQVLYLPSILTTNSKDKEITHDEKTKDKTKVTSKTELILLDEFDILDSSSKNISVKKESQVDPKVASNEALLQNTAEAFNITPKIQSMLDASRKFMPNEPVTNLKAKARKPEEESKEYKSTDKFFRLNTSNEILKGKISHPASQQKNRTFFNPATDRSSLCKLNIKGSPMKFSQSQNDFENQSRDNSSKMQQNMIQTSIDMFRLQSNSSPKTGSKRFKREHKTLIQYSSSSNRSEHFFSNSQGFKFEQKLPNMS